MAKKRFKIWFPVYANVCDTVELDEGSIPTDQEELKEKLIAEVFTPSLCHQCAHEVELGDMPMDCKNEDITFHAVDDDE